MTFVVPMASKTFNTDIMDNLNNSHTPGFGGQEPRLLQQVAHDLRQPVAAILALASAAQAEANVPASVLRYVEQISAEGGWILKVIGDLVEASGAQGAEPLAIGALLCDVVASERLTFTGHIELRQQDGELRYVLAASTRLRRALANVLSNATRAAGPGGCVELTAHSRGDAEIIEIADDGPGFGEVGQMHGIGLHITREILAECGGWMEIERLPCARTVVRLVLPLLNCGHRAGGR